MIEDLLFGCQVSGISVQPSRWPKKTASLIEIKTFGARSRNRLLLGFAFRKNTGNM
jgi:hypothetical protein